VIYFGKGNNTAQWVNLFNTAIYDTENKPSVLSVSWAIPENSVWLSSLDPVLQAAVTLGITIVAASGDYGTKGLSSTTNPTVCYPAVSPYVTAVGGTTLQLSPIGTIANEYVWNQGNASSGSGISKIYPLPSWQKELTAKNYPSGSVITINRRSIPDISANGDPATGAEFYYGLSNILSYTGGTSAAAPLIAGLIARFIENIGNNLGFLNSKFYVKSTAFRDITVGNNACPDIGLTTGYLATTGWDACTGIGTPIGNQLLSLLIPGKVKIDENNWAYIKDLKVKTSNTTWSPVIAVYTKTADGSWKQTYTAS
jgi:kumamolisin